MMFLNKQKQKQLEEYIEHFMTEHSVPGLAVAIGQGDEVVYSKAFGYRYIEEKVPATTDTIFGIASITKTVTAIAIAQLVEERLMSFDDPVQKILPSFRMPGGGGETVTVHHLLSHTSGMPPLPFLGRSFRAYNVVEGDAPAPPNTYAELLEAIANFPGKPYREPGQCLNYSNECYGILGAVVKEVSGMTFAEYVREKILRSLGMTRTMISFEEMFEHEDVTHLYTREGDELKSSTRWPTAPGFQAAGRLKSCCTDLVRIFQMYASGGTYRGVKILSEESVRQNMEKRFRFASKDCYAHALTVLPDYHGVTLVTHGGGGKGISSYGGFVPEKGISAVVLCNLSGVPVVQIWSSIINLALGLAIDTRRQEFTTSDWSPDDINRFTGHYKSAEGGKFKLVVEDGDLKLVQNGDAHTVNRIDDATGLMTVHGQPQEIRFYLGSDGKPWGVGQRTRIIPRA